MEESEHIDQPEAENERDNKHHARYAPSSLPVLMICPSFVSGDNKERNDDRDLGTKYHTALEVALEELQERGISEGWRDSLDQAGKDAVGWAFNKIGMELSEQWPVEVEERLWLLDDDFNEITFGTADVINGPNVFDLKTGERKDDFYWIQLVCYAFMLMRRDGYKSVRVRILYTRFRQICVFEVTYEEAEAVVMGLISELEQPGMKREVPNDYCKWCSKFITCEAVKKRVDAINAGREDWEVEDYHTSNLGDPVEMKKAWKLAKLMKKWVESVEYHAKQMHEAGRHLPQMRMTSRSGNRYINEILPAFDSLKEDLTKQEFLELCSVNVGRLEDALAEKRGISKGKAKKLIDELLGELVKRGRKSRFLQEIKTKNTNK